MNNRVIFAAAGSGKTYGICNEAIQHSSIAKKPILIITYTNEGINSIEREYRKQNFGVVDNNVIIKTWYSFLISELIKPYQRLLKVNIRHFSQVKRFLVPENYIRSIAFYETNAPQYRYNSSHLEYYLNNAHDIHKNEVSHLAIKCIDDSMNMVITRLESIYSRIYFDELQDYAGWDLEIISRLFCSNINMTCVGDHRQATFRTNNSPKNKQYRDSKIINFFIEKESRGDCQITYENGSHRLNSLLCNFVNGLFDDDIEIHPSSTRIKDDANNIGVFLVQKKNIGIYCDHYNPTILRYDRRTKIDFSGNCRILNYGESKGTTFDRIVITPVSTVLPFIFSKSSIKSPQTKSKFYVACTRARHSIVFVIDEYIENRYFEEIQLVIGGKTLPAYRHI